MTSLGPKKVEEEVTPQLKLKLKPKRGSDIPHIVYNAETEKEILVY